MLMLMPLVVELNPLKEVLMIDYWPINPFLGGSDPEPILRDVFDGWNTGNGIFSYLAEVTDLPWKDVETVDNTVLDIAYFGNHSGSKFCSPIVKLSIDADTGYVTQAARVTIAKILISKYLQNWKHLWETNVAVYTPIHNYDMTETRNLISADSMSENGNSNGQDVTAHGRTETEMDYKYGLNTDTENPRPSDRINSTEGGNTTTTSANSDQRNRVNAGEKQESSHRAGNIGVTTTQKLIQEERDLWLWNFFDQVFNDLDRELALMFHDPCRV